MVASSQKRYRFSFRVDVNTTEASHLFLMSFFGRTREEALTRRPPDRARAPPAAAEITAGPGTPPAPDDTTLMLAATVAHSALSPGRVDQDSSHCFGGGSEEVSAVLPGLLFAAD